MTQHTDYPPLPQKSVVSVHLPTGVRIYGYTDDDMRAYALADRAARGQGWQAIETAPEARTDVRVLLEDIARWKRVTSLPHKIQGWGSLAAFDAWNLDLWARFDAALATQSAQGGKRKKTCLTNHQGERYAKRYHDCPAAQEHQSECLTSHPELRSP